MRPSLLPLLACVLLAGTAGCQKASLPLPVRTLSEAQKKLASLCREEYGLTPVIIPLPNTLWVYVPLKSEILDIKANDGGAQKSDQAQTKPEIRYLDGTFANETLRFVYDIGPKTSYPQDFGYGSNYSESYLQTYRNTLTALARAYGDFETAPDGSSALVRRADGDIDFQGKDKNQTHKTLVQTYVPGERAPTFFVLAVTDIVRGIEMRAYGTLADLRRGMADMTFTGESIKRIFQDGPTGYKAAIGDTTGWHLEAKDMTWGEFLARQIVFRVRLSYTQTEIPPQGDIDDVFLRITAQTLQDYQFQDYRGVELRNLGSGTTFSFTPQQITTFRP